MDDHYEYFGVYVDETRDFAAQALTRRLKVIGLRRPARPGGIADDHRIDLAVAGFGLLAGATSST